MEDSNIRMDGSPETKHGLNQLDNSEKAEEVRMVEIDPELEKRVVRKIDRVLVPLVTALCKQLISYTLSSSPLIRYLQILLLFWTDQI